MCKAGQKQGSQPFIIIDIIMVSVGHNRNAGICWKRKFKCTGTHKYKILAKIVFKNAYFIIYCEFIIS